MNQTKAELEENYKALMNVMGNVAREYPEEEMTEDPIFLLQKTIPVYDENGDIVSGQPSRDNWETVSVWFTREEAEEFRRECSYMWPDKSRVHCIFAGGELADLLKVVTVREEK